MVRRILSAFTKEIRGLHEAAYVLACFSVFSQLLALVRDRTFAHLFGASDILDTYFAAFRVPDLLFAVLTLFVSSLAIIPLLSGRETKEQGVILANILFAFGVVSVVLSSVLWYAMPFVIPYFVPGFSDVQLSNTVFLSRIMLLQPILLGISSIASSAVQVMRRFVVYALAPILYNVGILIGALYFYPEYGLKGLAYGVVIGALFHALAQLVPILGHARHFSIPTTASLRASIVEVALPSMPRALALSVQQILLLVLTGVASIAGVGAVAALSFASNIQSVPLTVIGISYAAALFPALASLFSKNDIEKFSREVWASVRHIIFWTFPAIALIIVLRAQVVRVILGSGNFSWSDTRLTAALVALFSISLISQSLMLIFSRAFYASGNTKIPVIVNVMSALAAGGLAYFGVLWITSAELPRLFLESLLRVADTAGVASLMIPFSYSFSLIIASIIFARMFASKFGYDSKVSDTLMHSAASSILGASAAYVVLQLIAPLLPTETFIGIFAQGAIAGIAGLFVWIIMLRVLKSDELKEIQSVVSGKLARMVQK